MYKNEGMEMFKSIRAGETVKCPSCEGGTIGPVGNYKTTKAIKCDTCGKGIVLTVQLETYDDTNRI